MGDRHFAGRRRGSRRAAAALAMLAGFSALTVTGAAATGAGKGVRTIAAITLKPMAGPPTTKVTVSGSGFGMSEGVVVLFDSTVVVTTMSDGSGSVSTTFKVPKSALPGSHTVTVTGHTSGKVATATFTVRTDWAMAHFDVANTGDNPFENVLSASNVGTLETAGTGATNNPPGSPGGAPVVVDGVVYMTSWYFQTTLGATRLSAFKASCLMVPSKTCQPLWQADAAPVDIAVSNGVVYVALGNGQLAAYNAAGASAYCAGTPKICKPLWTGAIPGSTTSSGQAAVVANKMVYFPNENTLYAFNPAAPLGTGPGKCAGSFPNKTCNALWSTSVGISNNLCCVIRGKPAISKGVAYLSAGQLYALDATNGSLLWASNASNPSASSGSPSVSGGIVYSSTTNGVLSAFDTTEPNTNCTGTSPARTCTPIFNTGVGYSYSTPTIANGLIYTNGYGASGYLYAFNTSGAVVWKSAAGSTGQWSTPAVANGVLYLGNNNGNLAAYNTNVTAACSGTPAPTCPPLFTSSTAQTVIAPIIADGTVYAANGTATNVTAFRLP